VQVAVAPRRGHAAANRGTAQSRRPLIRLGLLKGFELTLDGVEVQLSTGLQHLLACLALQGRAMPRAHLAGILWSEVPDDRAAGNLRSALWRLRLLKVDLVGSARDCLSLCPGVVVDVHEAEKIARQAIDPRCDVESLTIDSLPFAGELLPGWYEDWIVIERERHRQIRLHTLEALCERWTNAGQHAKAVMAGMAAVSSEPLRESAHRALIKAYLAEGNPGEAIRQYQICRNVLRRELRLEPSALIKVLVQDLITL
jgi:DNA-binding SARP family transcriptional activator